MEHLLAVNGRSAGASAVLSLTGHPTDPLARGIRIRTAIETSGGALTTLTTCSGKAYGQTLVW